MIVLNNYWILDAHVSVRFITSTSAKIEFRVLAFELCNEIDFVDKLIDALWRRDETAFKKWFIESLRQVRRVKSIREAENKLQHSLLHVVAIFLGNSAFAQTDSTT